MWPEFLINNNLDLVHAKVLFFFSLLKIPNLLAHDMHSVKKFFFDIFGAYRFKTAEIANNFKSVFDKCREDYKASPAKQDEQDRGNVAAVKKELFKGLILDYLFVFFTSVASAATIKYYNYCYYHYHLLYSTFGYLAAAVAAGKAQSIHHWT